MAVPQSEFKVVFTSGESVILTGGSDLPEVLDANGYTATDINRIQYVSDVTPASVDHPEYPRANFCCPNCKNLLSLRRYEKVVNRGVMLTLFSYHCPNCAFETEGRTDPDRALVAMNYRCAHGVEVSKSVLDTLLKQADMYYEVGE